MDAVSLIKEILDFWFVECEQKSWWVRDPAFDAAVRERFGNLVVGAASGKLDHWAESAEGARALIILLDQFTRNIYRGTAKAFAADEKAREIARKAIACGFDEGLNRHEIFFCTCRWSIRRTLRTRKTAAVCLPPLAARAI